MQVSLDLQCKVHIVVKSRVFEVGMSRWTLCLLLAILLIGQGSAADVPLILGKDMSDVASYTSTQLEQAYNSSTEFNNVSPATLVPIGTTLEVPIVGGGNAQGTAEINASDLKKLFDSRVEPDNLKVRQKACELVAIYPGNYPIDQVCSIYGHLKGGWHYVSGTRGANAFFYANETLDVGKSANCIGVGNCGDFAILMSALIESIGGTTRIILARNNLTGSHAYAEVYLGQLNSSDSRVNEIIDWLKEEYKTDKVYVHVDTNTKEVWLNLDWGADEKGNAHPGGPFYPGDKHYVLCIREQFKKTPMNAPQGFGQSESPIGSDSMPDSRNSSVWVNITSTLINLGRNDEALQASKKAIELDPSYALAWNINAIALVNLGKNDEALQASQKAIELNPNLAWAWYTKGYALNSQIKYEEAVQAFDVAIKLDPNYVDAWGGKALALSRLGRNDEAIQALEKALDKTIDKFAETNASFALIEYTQKGYSFNQMGKYDEAIQAFDKAIEISPQYAEAWNGKSYPLYNQGKYDEAIHALNKAIEINPKYAEAWNNKGFVLNSQGKYEEAIQAYDKAIEINPQNVVAWNNKGNSLYYLGKYEESNQAYDKAIKLENEYEPKINIICPINGEEVGLGVSVKGTIKGELPDSHYLWILVNPHSASGWWWPQGADHIWPYAGEWHSEATIGRDINQGGAEDIGNKFDIAAILVNRTDNKVIFDWVNNGTSSGGIRLPDSARIMHLVTVIRK